MLERGTKRAHAWTVAPFVVSNDGRKGNGIRACKACQGLTQNRRAIVQNAWLSGPGNKQSHDARAGPSLAPSLRGTGDILCKTLNRAFFEPI